MFPANQCKHKWHYRNVWWLDVKEHNQRVQAVYEKAGFKREGILRECLKTEIGYESLVILSI